MSAICQNFVQNAWKKDLCSNCFKSKDEHSQAKPKLVPINLNKCTEGIIKSSRKSKPKRSVEFTKELTVVIGFGGEDWYSEEEQEEEIDDNEDDDDDDDVPDGEEEKELQKLTKANTDFNANIPQDVEIKKSFTQLLLGKPQFDAEGKKQTLLVTVTPFGQDGAPKKYSKSISHIPVAKNNKETLAESKTNIVLTSYTKNGDKEEKSLLDEISETLENGKNPIQIMSRKKTEKELILCKPDVNGNKENIVAIEKNEVDEKTDVKKSSIPERKNGLSRTPVIKRDQEKPVIFQTSIAKIELMNTKNLNNNNTTKDFKLQNGVEKGEPPKEATEKSTEEPNVDKTESENIVNEPTISKDQKEESSDDSITSTLSSSDESKSSNEVEMIDKKKTNDKVLGLPPLPKLMVIPQSREQAGEPDGRADPEETEPPALPLTPPPALETHGSFLHGNAKPCDKPKIPSKPSTIMIRKPVVPPMEPQPVLTTFILETKPEILKTKLEKQDSNGSDICKSVNKRKAPQPPSEEVVEEKKDRYSLVSDSSQLSEGTGVTPEPAPRKSLSLSTDNLLSGGEEKKKRGRFSLKKFLRMGSSKDLAKISNDPAKIEDLAPPPQVKPRLVIVHPSELNGDKVEVVAKSNPPIDVPDYSNLKVLNQIPKETAPQKGHKPPPPPRNFEEYPYIKPNLPHPPKSQEIMNKQREFSKNPNSRKVETVYANIGEVRSAIVPNKPHRTASMREREALQQKRNASNYEPINISKDSNENVYDYINSARSSSPECDSSKSSPTSKSPRSKNGLAQRSESHGDVSGDYFKYQNIPRSMSLTYCGSETESEIYSPYSFYGSESEVAEDDSEWTTPNGKTHKLRSKKGRSIVHKNLEDNYGAVIVANHEALAQVLENIQHTVIIQPALRGLKTSPSLRWSDFTIKGSAQSLELGPRAFHQGIWGSQHVTLVISTGTVATSTLSLGVYTLNPITEFSDLVPIQYLPGQHAEDAKLLQATVAVLPWMQVHTVESYGELLKAKANQAPDESWKDASFILLQLVNSLKILQAQGIEELPSSLSSFVLCREIDKDSYYRLFVLQGLGEDLSRKKGDSFDTLCVCASNAMKQLQVTSKITTLIQNLLKNERAVSLTQVKSVLEFSLWGPSDVALGSTIRERELAVQRWLDLQRATVLHGLVCTKVHLTVYEECHLLFLVRSTARMMCDASMLLESNNKQNGVTNGHK